MDDQVTRRKDDSTAMPEAALAQTKVELVPEPPREPSLGGLTAAIRKGHGEVERNALNIVGWAIQTGKALRAAKQQVRHGHFEDYVAVECRIAMRTAQNYMKLARHEAEILQSITENAHGHAYLTLGEALKTINKLSANSQRRKRANPKPA